MAELKFLRGLLTSLPASGKSNDNFYVTTGNTDDEYRLYLGDILLAQGDVVKRLEDLETAVGEGGSVADKITAAIEALDVSEIKSEGQAIVAVSETDGKISATAGDIAASHVTIADAEEKLDAATVEAALLELVTKLETETVNRQNAITALTKTVEDADKAITDRLDVIEGEAEVEGSIKKAVADAKAAIEGTLEDGDATTLAELNDRINTVIADGKTYSIAKVTDDELSTLGSNVKEAFKLVDEDGTTAGEYIKVYKDSALQSVVLDGQELVFTYLLDSGEESVVRVDVSTFLAEAEFKNGLEVVNHVVNVKVDAASESFLTVDADGVKLSGVQDAIDDAVSAETAARKTAIEALDAVVSGSADHVSVEVTEVDGVITAVNVTESDIASASATTAAIAAEATAREEADNAINDTIGTVDSGKTVVGMIADEATAREAADKAINDTIGEVAEGETVVSMIAAEKTAREEAAAAETERVNKAIAAEATAREEADNALDGRLDALEAVEVTGKDAIVVSANGATENKEVSLKLAPQPAEGEAGVVLSQDVNGLKATLQWGTF